MRPNGARHDTVPPGARSRVSKKVGAALAQRVSVIATLNTHTSHWPRAIAVMLLCAPMMSRADDTPFAAPTVAPNSAAGPALSAPIDRALMCAQPGVFVCDDFTGTHGLAGTLTPNNLQPVPVAPRIEAGSLVFDIPAHSGTDAGGSYRLSFPALGAGKFLAFSYRVKADAAALALPGRKEFILWRGASSCTDLVLAQTHYYSLPVLRPYTECGATNFDLPNGPSDLLLQYPDYNCTYQGIRTSLRGCAITHADIWENFYIELKIGHLNAPDSQVVMWHRSDGGVWRRYIDRQDFPLRGDGGFENFMLTVYMTGKDPALAHPAGEVRYDYLIMSTEPLDKETLGRPF